MVAAALFMGALATGCSDWDDHYVADATQVGSSDATIWQNIQSNPQLTQFAALLQRTGYDQILNTTQSYTVWAPLDGTFDYDAINAETNDIIISEFIKNHVARYNYPASGTIDERIYMLNRKVEDFTGSGTYTIGDVAVATPNIANNNGIMHTINGKIAFMPNIYETLDTKYFAIDSVANYFHKYDLLELDENNSVQGPIVEGQITYLDSVFIEDNDIFNRFSTMLGSAYINREDSSYTMILPTNKAWASEIKKVESYLNYAETVEFNDQSDNDADTTYTYNAAYLKDSLSHMLMSSGLIYNNNIRDNKPLKNLQTGGTLNNDSLTSYAGIILYQQDANNLFTGATRYDRSNGAVWVTDSFRLKPWNYACWPIKLEAETSNLVVSSAYSSTRLRVTENTQNPNVKGGVSGGSYVEISNGTNNPNFYFYLPDVMATTYNIYGVFIPSNITNEYDTLPLANQMRVQIYYNTADGKQAKRAQTLNSKLITDPTKIDTCFIGEFTFPICYYGLEDCAPSLFFQGSGSKTQDRNIRLDCIILRPKELDDYVNEHPDYEYYDYSTY